VNVLSSPRTTADREVSSDQPHPPKPLIENIAMSIGVVGPVIGLAVGIYLLWGHGVGWLDLLLLLAFYTITTLGITIGYHRMFTHRALQGGPAVRGVLAVCGSMAGQGPVIEWCAMHRQHHKHADRPGDPHSPHLHGDGPAGFFKGMWHAHVGWLYADSPPGVAKGVPDLVADPVLRFVDRLFWLWMLLGWILPGVIGGLASGSWFGFLTGCIWGGLVRQFLLHHTTFSVNSVCHVWGSRPFKSTDESRNNAIFGVLTFGEGWHNNHHAFPTSARHGLRWWQLDISWLVIRALQAVGLVWNVRLVSPGAMAVRRNVPSAASAADAPSVNAAGPA